MVNELYGVIIKSLIFILPSYVANGAPVLSSKLFTHRHPIDMGKVLWDSRRILGDGKTYEGFFIGLSAGILTGYVLEIVGYHTVEGAAVLSLGTMIGDIAGSFIKRRLNIKRGGKAPLLDQLTFLYFALLLYHVVFDKIEFTEVIFLSIITPLLHRFTNYIAYKLGLKDNPW